MVTEWQCLRFVKSTATLVDVALRHKETILLILSILLPLLLPKNTPTTYCYLLVSRYRYSTVPSAQALLTPDNQQSPTGVEVSTPCEAVPTREINVFIHGVLGFVV